MFDLSFDHVKDALSDHEPEIWAGLGIALAIKAAIDGIKVAIDGTRTVDKKRAEIAKEKKVPIEEVKLEKKEVAKMVFKKAIVPTTEMILAAAFIARGVYLPIKNSQMWAAAYMALDQQVKYEKEAATEMLGKNKVQKIEDAAAEKKATAQPFNDDLVLNTGVGSTLFWDDWYGRWFIGDIQSVKEAINRCQFNMNNSQYYMSTNEVYMEIGRVLGDTSAGSCEGWNSSDIIEARFEARALPNGRNYFLMIWETKPSKDFMDTH